MGPRLPPELVARPIAHRGLHDRAAGVIENSRAAIRAAVASGYAVEIDVRTSADGEAIVIHDATLDRVTNGLGAVAALTAEEIGRLSLVGAAAPEPPPRLSEVLADLAGRAPVFIEVKDGAAALGPIDGRLEARVAELLARYDGPVALMSFNPSSVARLRDAAPETPRGLIGWSFEDVADAERRAALAGLADFDAVGASFVSYRWSDLPQPSVAERRAAGAPVVVWTIRRPEEAAASRAHADQITFEGFAP